MRALARSVVAALMVVGLAGGSAGSAGAATDYGAPFQEGPKNGDAHVVTQADPQTGTVTIFQHNTRSAGVVHCIGEGPRATLQVTHQVTEPVSWVRVDYTDAVLLETIIMSGSVVGSSSGPLGNRAEHGPKIFESGTLDIPLFDTPAVGETLTMVFGLQAHAGCLPVVPLGLPGSLPVEAARATFASVSVG